MNVFNHLKSTLLLIALLQILVSLRLNQLKGMMRRIDPKAYKDREGIERRDG